jgi:hypothetical protein
VFYFDDFVTQKVWIDGCCTCQIVAEQLDQWRASGLFKDGVTVAVER